MTMSTNHNPFFPKIKILDCTIRDGGYVNHWQFSRALVRDWYQAVSAAGVDFAEFGYRMPAAAMEPVSGGVWRYTPEETLADVLCGLKGAGVALMVDYGRADIKDIPDRQQSPVSLYRVAVHRHQIKEALSFSEAIMDKGYQAAIQLMGIGKFSAEDFGQLLKPLSQSRLSFVYFADSYGSLFPSDIPGIVRALQDTGKPLGFHAHNNLQLAFANTLEAIRSGVEIVDGTVYGMGRAAGNLPLEILLAYLEKFSPGRYQTLPVLKLIETHFLNLAKEYSWGYNLPYMLSAVSGIHPEYARMMVSLGKYTLEDIRALIQKVNAANPIGFDRNLILQKMTPPLTAKADSSVSNGSE